MAILDALLDYVTLGHLAAIHLIEDELLLIPIKANVIQKLILIKQLLAEMLNVVCSR